MSTVMVAQSEAGLRKRIERVLSEQNFKVESVSDGLKLRERLKVYRPDLLLLDFHLADGNWMTILKSLHERGDHIPVLMVGDSAQASAMDAPISGGEMLQDHVNKPVDAADLVLRVQRALAKDKARPSIQVPLRELHDRRSGRIDAKSVAEHLGVPLPQLAKSLGVNYATVHKTPAAPALQKGLRPIKRSLELVSRMTRSHEEARAWLNNPHPDLGEQTPLDVILSGRASALVTLLDNAMAGIPG